MAFRRVLFIYKWCRFAPPDKHTRQLNKRKQKAKVLVNVTIFRFLLSFSSVFGIQFAIIYDESAIISINYCSLFSPKTLIQIGENIASSTISTKKLIIFTKFLLNFSKKY